MLLIIQFPVYLWVSSTKDESERMAELSKYSPRSGRKMDPFVDSELLIQTGAKFRLRFDNFLLIKLR